MYSVCRQARNKPYSLKGMLQIKVLQRPQASGYLAHLDIKRRRRTLQSFSRKICSFQARSGTIFLLFCALESKLCRIWTGRLVVCGGARNDLILWSTALSLAVELVVWGLQDGEVWLLTGESHPYTFWIGQVGSHRRPIIWVGLDVCGIREHRLLSGSKRETTCIHHESFRGIVGQLLAVSMQTVS